ncbi:MAG: TetR/AcrR family transcriptional regulator [Hydrogenophaga sp.]|nr:TetR/AcrR family transcriptional regulator [Hydrogenophaga sp.]
MSLKSTNKRTSVAPDADDKPKSKRPASAVAQVDAQAKPNGKSSRLKVVSSAASVPVKTMVAKKKTVAPVAVANKSPVASTPVVVKRSRSNRRSEITIANILAATENIVLESGAERISILDVCRAANVSRGTFYRYFASQDELLDAFSRHKRERFHVALAEAVESCQDPDERFAALIRYLDYYLEHGRARRLLVVAPEYALGFFRRIFHDSVVRFQDVLSVVFDAWEARLGVKLDRELVCELLIRYVLSEQLVPGDTDRKALPRRIGRLVESLTAGTSSRARR